MQNPQIPRVVGTLFSSDGVYLGFIDLQTINVTVCGCYAGAEALIAKGLFPASPAAPKLSVSIDLLEFYRALFEQ